MRRKTPDARARAAFRSRRALSAIGLAALLGLWSLAALGMGAHFVPPPWTTIADAAVLLSQSSTWTQILITLMRVCLGFACGYLFGAAAGIAMGARPSLASLLEPTILFFQGIPPLLWAIPLVVIMGVGHLPAIIVIALITLPVIAVTVGEGMAGLPRPFREMLDVFAPGLLPRIRELIFPHLRPFFTAALNVGLVLSVKASVTAEYFASNNGIGFQIQSAYQSFRIRGLFSWGLVLILIVLSFNNLIPRFHRIAAIARKPFARRVPVTCGVEDVRELRGIFTARKSRPRVRLESVTFSYRRGEKLLENIDLRVDSGEIAVITGDSGVGKSTLLKLCASLLKPSGGIVSCPAGIGMVFQDDRLLPWRSVTENAALPLLYQGRPRKSALCFASSLLEEAGLGGEGERSPDELSGGMKKRAALARCFARIPEAILMDEPFSGLHRDARRSLWDVFLRLLALHPVPVIVVTHSPEEIAPTPSCRLYSLRGKPAALFPVKKSGSGRRRAPP